MTPPTCWGGFPPTPLSPSVPSLPCPCPAVCGSSPPDGSHVFYHLLPPGWGLKYRQFYALGMLPLLLILWLAPGVIDVFLWPAQQLMNLGLAVVGGLRIGAAS